MNRYRIVRPIRRGGTAELFEALVQGDGGFQRRVALKRMLKEHADDESFNAAFVDEAKIASHLHHANIVAVLDFGEMDGLPFQVLELVDGFDLGILALELKERKLPIGAEIALYIVTEIATALDYAHTATDAQNRELEIVHRDVSPENILISWAGDVKLADFGIARSLERRAATRADVARGKRAYMAPEQARGELADARADIFALGCVLHRILTGSSPLESDAVRRDVLAGMPVPLDPDIPEDLARIIQKATEPDKKNRYATAGVLRSDCIRALAKRADGDGRALLRALMSNVRPADTLRPENPLNAFMMLELVLKEQSGDLRRFESVIAQPITVREEQSTATNEEDTPATDGEKKRSREDSHPPVIIPQSVIGPYRIERMIGQGGFAGVYRAFHLILGTEVALKVLHAGFDEHSIPGRRFAREIAVLEKLDHPCLVRVRDSGVTEDGRPWLAMDLLRGRTLHAMTSGTKMSVSRAWSLSRDVAAGLAVAHRHGIIHRDLKPRNIILITDHERERAKIVDFGIAVLIGPEAEHTRFTQVGGRLGTPRWMAPEQIIDASNVGPSTDLYALGLLMYTMVAGHPPFDCPEEQVIKKHLEERPPPLPEAGDLEAVIFSLLEKDPKRRPESAEEVIAALDGLELGQTWDPTSIVPPREPTTLAPQSAPIRITTTIAHPKSRALLLVGMAGLLVMLAVAVALARRPEINLVQAESQPVVQRQPQLQVQSVQERPVQEDIEPEVELDPSGEPERPAIEEIPVKKRPKRRAAVLEEPAKPEPLTPSKLRSELSSLRGRLAAQSTSLPPDRFRALDRRWLDLRSVLSDDLQGEALSRLSRDIAALRAEINAE